MIDSNSSYFPFELLREILLKLSVKSLIRFAVISKLWHSLITSFPFIFVTWPKIRIPTPFLLGVTSILVKKERYSLFQDGKNRPFSLNFISELNIPFNHKIEYSKIVGSCNDIMCFYNDLLGELRSLVLGNPSIQKSITLPSPSIKSQSPLMFVFEFGADLPETHNYKLVRLVYHENGVVGYNSPPEIEIYSTNSGVWRRLMGVEIKHHMVEFMWSQSFINGVIHWIAYDVVANNDEYQSLLVPFSIADEVFREIMLPDALVGVHPMNLSVMLFEESLAIIKYQWEIDSDSCEV